jgi:hypothetical protein
MEAWVTRTLTGIAPADDEARKVFDKHALGTTFPINIASRVTRSGQWHKKYWLLASMLADNLDQVELEPGLIMPIRSKEDVHVALKYATGLFDSYALPGGIVRVVKSTAFDAMTPDAWSAYWVKVLDAVHRIFLPNIAIATVENELARLAS